jgi:hypothetical protein
VLVFVLVLKHSRRRRRAHRCPPVAAARLRLQVLGREADARHVHVVWRFWSGWRPFYDRAGAGANMGLLCANVRQFWRAGGPRRGAVALPSPALRALRGANAAVA